MLTTSTTSACLVSATTKWSTNDAYMLLPPSPATRLSSFAPKTHCASPGRAVGVWSACLERICLRGGCVSWSTPTARCMTTYWRRAILAMRDIR